MIVRRADVLAFVEVKSRTGKVFGSPEEAVTWRKRREIEVVARDFLLRYPHDDVCVRFDVIAITASAVGCPHSYRHIADAWRPESRWCV